MPTIEFYGIIISFSRDHPAKAKDILDGSICQSYRLTKDAYYVGMIKILIVACFIAFAIILAIFVAWCMIFVAFISTVKLILLAKDAAKNYELMSGFRQLQEKGIDYEH